MVEECMFAEEIANHKALDTVDVEKILIQQIQQYWAFGNFVWRKYDKTGTEVRIWALNWVESGCGALQIQDRARHHLREKGSKSQSEQLP